VRLEFRSFESGAQNGMPIKVSTFPERRSPISVCRWERRRILRTLDGSSIRPAFQHTENSQLPTGSRH
jgi:hypothetical protein